MEHNIWNDLTNGYNGLWLTLGTFFIYVLSVITVQEWAAIGAALAGFSTAAYNTYRFVIDRKEKKAQKKKRQKKNYRGIEDE